MLAEPRPLLTGSDLTDIMLEMPLRFLVILSFLLQHMAVSFAAIGAMRGDCEPSSCCVPVEVTTCCGEVAVEVQCGESMGECRCGIRSGESGPRPEAPPPASKTGFDLTGLSATSPTVVLTMPVRGSLNAAAPALPKSHNQTQALLCIWRT